MFEIVEENKNVKTVKISLDHEVIDAARNAVYDEISKDIKVKGFRPGMVPRNLINTIIGMDRVNDLVKEHVVDEASSILSKEYDKSLNILLPPMVKNVELGGTADVVFELHLFPKVEIESMKDVEIKVPNFGDLENHVNESLEELREEKAILVPKEPGQTAEVGDTVEIEYFDLSGKDPEKKTLELKIGEPNEGTIFPHVIGKKIGDEFDFKSTSENTENKTNLHVKVSGLYLRKLPDLDDNFAKMVDEKYETLDDLKASLKKDVDKSIENLLSNIKRDEIIDEMIKKTKIDVLDSTIDYFASSVIERKKEDKAYDKELKEKFNNDEKAYLESAKSEVINYLKLEGALKLIANERSLSVSDDEIFETAKQIYKGSKISEERLKVMLKKDSELYSSINKEILSNKVADELLKDAIFVEDKVGEGAKESENEEFENKGESEGQN